MPHGKPSETMELSTKAGSCTGHSWLQKQIHTQARQLCTQLQGHMAKKEKKKKKREKKKEREGRRLRTRKHKRDYDEDIWGEVSAEEVPSCWVLEGIKYKR